ncbi:hypothetical protein O4H61_15850 [Roseovarius aestuarii]|nr:hypothetical protein [Roseovarius aestuarii]
MTTDTTPQADPQANDALKGRWALKDVQPETVLDLLPGMDRVMIAIRGGNFIHERLGTVDSVSSNDGNIVIKGAEQDITVPENTLQSVVLDISTEMRGKLYPRLEFQGADGTRIMSVTGLEGINPFDAALSSLSRSAIDLAPVPTRGDDPTPEIAPDDPGLTFLSQFSDNKDPVQIRALCADAVQRWDGVIEKIVPMGGHINVMTSGFHLHLAAGAVAHWESDGGIHRAMDDSGHPIGLEVVAP